MNQVTLKLPSLLEEVRDDMRIFGDAEIYHCGYTVLVARNGVHGDLLVRVTTRQDLDMRECVFLGACTYEGLEPLLEDIHTACLLGAFPNEGVVSSVMP